MASMFDDRYQSRANASRVSKGVPSFLAEKCEADNALDEYRNAGPTVPWPESNWRKEEGWRNFMNGDGKTFNFDK